MFLDLVSTKQTDNSYFPFVGFDSDGMSSSSKTENDTLENNTQTINNIFFIITFPNVEQSN
ncbi:hypothetical protein SPBRAN_1967 [uncultured Candidatus Thioglobus sp.]|nr:hypothetical protein SPBRAN_1967 [uncultured Candidatus Thioglobus sp.]